MLALVLSIWMSLTIKRGEGPDIREFLPTILACVLGFLRSFIQFVTAFVLAIRMTLASKSCKSPDIGIRCATVLTIIFSHKLKLYKV